MEVRSRLAKLIAQIESGDNPNAPHDDYIGNYSPNAQYQQSAAFVHAWGNGAQGVDNLARWLLRGHPWADLGDYYCVYNHGSLLPWSSYSARFPRQAYNFTRKAQAAGYSRLTSLGPMLTLI